MKKIVDPIVIDVGRGFTKCGFAGEEGGIEKIFPTIVGIPNQKIIQMNNNFVGNEAICRKTILELERPISNFNLINFTNLSLIYQHVYKLLGIKETEEYPIFLTDIPNSPKHQRTKISQIFFEEFSVPSLLLKNSAVCSLISCGKMSGTVLECGFNFSRSVSVYQGFEFYHSTEKLFLGGDDITDYLKSLYSRKGCKRFTRFEKSKIDKIKHGLCYVSKNYLEDKKKVLNSNESYKKNYFLPDNSIISLHSERFEAPEILFQPKMVRKRNRGIHEMCYKTITNSPSELRNMLLNNIVVSGGSTMFKGFNERLSKEISKLSNKKIIIENDFTRNRSFYPFIGCSVLANISSLNQSISREEYFEFGNSIIHRKNLLPGGSSKKNEKTLWCWNLKNHKTFHLYFRQFVFHLFLCKYNEKSKIYKLPRNCMVNVVNYLHQSSLVVLNNQKNQHKNWCNFFFNRKKQEFIETVIL